MGKRLPGVRRGNDRPGSLGLSGFRKGAPEDLGGADPSR